jgi:hypothetical protein
MNTIEERIRAAARAAADTVPPDSVPPLRLPPEQGSRRSRSAHRGWAGRGRARVGWAGPGWGGWARRLTPLAAAVAVVVVVITVVGIGRTLHSPAGSARITTSGPGPVVAGPPISSYVASGQVPPYYVAITSRDDKPTVNPSYAVVTATASGKTLATIQPSVAHGTIVAVTAAADDRTFVLDEERLTTSATDQDYGARTFYEFRLTSSGQPGPLTRLAMSVPSGQQLNGLALSPNGSKLAMALQPETNNQPDLTLVKVYILATGAVRTWTGNGSIGFGPDDARSLSWTSDERTLAFDWNGTDTESQLSAGVRLLHLDARGSNLLADSRQALPAGEPQPGGGVAYEPTSPSASVLPGTATPEPTASSSSALTHPPACQEDLIITPDGSKVVCGAIQFRILTSGVVNDETEFREFSAATGEVTDILGHWRFHNVIPNVAGVLWSNSSGSVLIGVIPGGGNGRIGVISGNSFTPLPASAASASASWADDYSGTW